LVIREYNILHATRTFTKCFYLDFDDDGIIKEVDVKNAVLKLWGNQKIEPQTLNAIVDNVIDEGDVRKMKAIGPQEFRNMMTKSSEFGSNFTLRL